MNDYEPRASGRPEEDVDRREWLNEITASLEMGSNEVGSLETTLKPHIHDTRRQVIEKVEIGDLGMWSASSCKSGFGVELLRDQKIDTFWQSDAAPPHSVYVVFPKRMTLCELQIYLDHRLDESYTPQVVKVLAGLHHHDLNEVARVEWQQPVGWMSIPLYDDFGLTSVPEGTSERPFLKTFILQIMVLSNQQMGRDSHIRLIHIYGPRPFRLLQKAHGKLLHIGSWEGPQSLHLDDEAEMTEAIRQLETKMEIASHSQDMFNVTDTRKDVSQWMEKYATAVDQLNSEQRADVYRKYGTQIDRLKMQLLQLYKIRER